MEKMPVSVLMLTLNEEANLPGALENAARWAEAVYIVDSLSTDRTVDIALEHGATVVQRRFTNFGDQWNWALRKLPVTTPWSFVLAPDERLGERLESYMRRLFERGPTCNGYRVRRRLWFMGKPLRVVTPELRLWRTGMCRYSDVIVNEHPLVPAPLGNLRGTLEHLDSPHLHHWFEKQNRYSTMEAIARAKKSGLAVKPRLWGDRLERRMFVKSIFHHLPFRYQALWLYHAFFQGAILDGSTGLAWVHLRLDVHRARAWKAKEMLRTGRIPEIPVAPHGDFDPRVLASRLQQQLISSDENRTEAA